MPRTALYRFFDAEDVLLYIGITDNTARRWNAHKGDKSWWPDVARKAVEWYDNQQDAADVEWRAIRAEQPLHNIAHRTHRRERVIVTAETAGQSVWWDYVKDVTRGAQQSEIAEKTGITATTISRWKTAAHGTRPENVTAFARAYDRPVLEALVAAGFLSADEAKVTEVSLPRDPSQMDSAALATEIQRLVDELRRRAT
jgi:transcriptional regulator with XRE-family HTH domain/predicted GIY-YIG superfamily endonuclease